MRNPNEIKQDIMASINLIDGEEFSQTLSAICSAAACIVKKTLGPYARTTVLDNGMDTYSTKDGWSVLDYICFDDPIYSVLYKLIKNISFTLNSRVGDGTTTALVVADHFVQQFNIMTRKFREEKKSIRQADLLNKVTEICAKVTEELVNRSVKISNFDEIYNIAMVATNRNAEISGIIKDIYEKTGNPNIHVAVADGDKTYASINRGYKLECHLLWADIYCNENTEYLLPEGCDVYVFDHTVKYSEHFEIISTILSIANRTNTPAIIFAPNYDETFLSAIGSSIKNCKGMPLCALVQATTTNPALKNYLMDFTALAGTEMFTYTKVRMYNYLARVRDGKEFDQEEFKDLFGNADYKDCETVINQCRGYAPRLTLTKKYALLEEFSKDTNLYKANLSIITREYEEQKAKVDKHADNLDKDYMNAQLRYIKFIGNTGTIYIGGESDIAKKCLRDAVLDATLACKAAFEDGYIRGLNIETLSVLHDLSLHPYYGSNDEYRGIIDALATSFLATSIDVLSNKITNSGEDLSSINVSWNYNDMPKEMADKNIPEELLSSVKRWRELYFTEDDTAMDNKMEMIKVINSAMKWDICYDIVTEAFTTDIINSVTTDCEIIRATTSIVSMLLSSNQLISLNRRINAEAAREKSLKTTEEIAEAQAQGFIKAMYSNEIQHFEKKSEHVKDAIMHRISVCKK